MQENDVKTHYINFRQTMFRWLFKQYLIRFALCLCWFDIIHNSLRKKVKSLRKNVTIKFSHNRREEFNFSMMLKSFEEVVPFWESSLDCNDSMIFWSECTYRSASCIDSYESCMTECNFSRKRLSSGSFLGGGAGRFEKWSISSPIKTVFKITSPSP